MLKLVAIGLFAHFTAVIKTQQSDTNNYLDYDVKCEPGQRLGYIGTSSTNEVKRHFELRCDDMYKWNNNLDHCSYKLPMKCHSINEACADHQWLAGLRVIDVGTAVPVLMPYCCWSKYIQLSNCLDIQISSLEAANAQIGLPPGKVYSSAGCQLVINQGGDIVDARYRLQECSYTVLDGSMGSRHGSKRAWPSDRVQGWEYD